jgi:hypothetical protein
MLPRTKPAGHRDVKSDPTRHIPLGRVVHPYENPKTARSAKAEALDPPPRALSEEDPC